MKEPRDLVGPKLRLPKPLNPLNPKPTGGPLTVYIGLAESCGVRMGQGRKRIPAKIPENLRENYLKSYILPSPPLPPEYKLRFRV